MPTFEQEMQSRAKKARAEREAKQKKEAEERRQPKLKELQRLEALCVNEDLQWFLDTFAKPIHDAAQANALDIKLSPADRNDWAQRRHAAEAMLGLLTATRNAWREALKV